MSLELLLAFSFSSFIFGHIALNLSKKHGALQLLFMGSCITMMMLSMVSVSTTMDINKLSSLGYKIIIINFIMFLVYFFYTFISNLTNKSFEVEL